MAENRGCHHAAHLRQYHIANPTHSVLYVAYSLATVSDESCGGAEQLLFALEREMAGRGHRTTVAACTGSVITGELLDTGAPAICFEQLAARDAEHNASVLRAVKRRAQSEHSFDLVHDHGGRFWPHAGPLHVPILATLHLPRSFYPPELLTDVPQNVLFNCVSESQFREFSSLPRMLGVVQNGVAVERFSFTARKSGYLVWLGRICPEKGAHIALEVAERAQKPLIIMGPSYLFPADKQYFDEQIAPRLARNSRIRFVGSPSFAQKVAILKHASGLLMPSLLPETSSLVCMEAMACGTPAIASRSGALPEVVAHGKTGFLVDSVEDMIEAVRRLDQVNPADCRTHVEKNHSASIMARHYERLYAQLATACGMRAEFHRGLEVEETAASGSVLPAL